MIELKKIYEYKYTYSNYMVKKRTKQISCIIYQNYLLLLQ